MIPSIGRIVHFVLPNGEHRPAIIVRIFDSVPTERSLVQLQVFTDGGNDADQSFGIQDKPGANIAWVTSVEPDQTGTTPRTYHFPERV